MTTDRQLVELEHPNLPGQPITVPAPAVPHHERAGWRPIGAAASPVLQDTAPPPETTTED